MRRILCTAVVFLLLSAPYALADRAVGSSFGALATAKSLGLGKANFGFGLGLADATSFVGAFTYGLSEYTDGRIKIGLVDHDNADTKLTIGADFKWQFWNYGVQTDHPFDFAVGGFFEYADFGSYSAFQLGGQLIGSYPFTLTRGGTLSPYGRFNARLEAISLDLPQGSADDDSQSNLEIGLNAGVAWQMTPTISLFGEFQIDGNDGLFLGIDFNVM